MESEKKKKQQRKKKNKQSNTSERVNGGVGGSTEHNLLNGTDHHDYGFVSKNADVPHEGFLKTADTDSETNLTNSCEKAHLEAYVLQSKTEKSSWFQKEADLEMKFSQLQTRQDTWQQKEVNLDGKIGQLEREKLLLEEAKASIEERVVSLTHDGLLLRGQVMELEASRSHLLHQNQQLTETISSLQSQIQNLENAVVASSRMYTSERDAMDSQLKTAQALVDKLIAENANLTEKVSELNAELERRTEATKQPLPVGSDAMMENFATTGAAESSDFGADHTDGIAETAAMNEVSALATSEIGESAKTAGTGERSAVEMFEYIERSGLSEGVELVEGGVAKPEVDGGSYLNSAINDAVPYCRESMESDEIVLIPLDENEVKVTELEISSIEKDDVPLMDAPLIGAPFRFVSFVARYISGADLVGNSSSKMGR